MKLVVHTCEVRHSSGGRFRIVAVRQNRRATLADFDILAIAQEPGQWPKIVGEFPIHDFPRALGAEMLFANILGSIPQPEVSHDEEGKVVEMPEPPEVSKREWWVRGREHLREARECMVKAGVFDPEIIEPVSNQMEMGFLTGGSGQ